MAELMLDWYGRGIIYTGESTQYYTWYYGKFGKDVVSQNGIM